MSGAKRGRGRPPTIDYRPTEQDRTTVQIMVAGGIQQANICKCLGVTRHTLRRHFRHEIETAAEQANARVVQSLFQMATAGDGMQKFNAARLWLYHRLGWRDAPQIANPADAGALVVSFSWADATPALMAPDAPPGGA